MKSIESHPGKPLITHLKEVAHNCLAVAEKKQPAFVYGSGVLKELLFICGFFHDIGKATSYFQYYLHHPDEPTTQLKNHALPSAVFVFYYVGELLKDRKAEKDVFLLQTLCFIVVKRHHGNLQNYKEELGLRSTENLEKQYESIDKTGIQEIIDFANEQLKLNGKWKDFLNWFKDGGFEREIQAQNIRFYKLDFQRRNIPQRSEIYYLFLWMFGVLLFSDKSDVILEGDFPKLKPIDYIFLTDYRQNHQFHNPKTEINKLKNEAFFSVLESLEKKYDSKQHFYSISLPTGLGKTLTSLGAAMKMKGLAFPDKESKIIIAIPFTSIIDQNYQVYQEVLQNPDSSLLLKHHHLAEPKYKEGEDAIRDANQSQYLIETWQSSMVVTTFVQLLEVLITNNKSKLLKLSSLANSIIILDEVQQIPHHLWELIRLTFFKITEHLNCYIILMSATQPLIFRPKEEIIELVQEPEKYFSFFNRTKLINKTAKKISLEDFSSNILEYAEENPSKDILVILNTKKITLETYRKIKEWDEFSDTENELIYLSTLITPFERKEKITAIKKDSGKRKIIVSTQLVEAGVDISVDTVFRALAPFDSIIQAAGRANRYNEKETVSEVYLYKIEELNKATNFIYGADLIKKTENVLKGKTEIAEEDYLGLIQAYFKEVKDLSQFTNEKYLKDIAALNFEETGKFQLIESAKSESLFIGLNETAIVVWNQFVQIQENQNLNSFEKREAFQKIKSTFYDFVININIKYGENDLGLPFEKTYGFYFIDVENQQLPFYNCDACLLKNDEGYIFNGIEVLSF